jgi:hypothetical protein
MFKQNLKGEGTDLAQKSELRVVAEFFFAGLEQLHSQQ